MVRKGSQAYWLMVEAMADHHYSQMTLMRSTRLMAQTQDDDDKCELAQQLICMAEKSKTEMEYLEGLSEIGKKMSKKQI